MAIPSQPEPNPARNEPCYCGSGKKYKRCCGAADKHPELALPPIVPRRRTEASRFFGVAALLLFVGFSIYAMIAISQRGDRPEATGPTGTAAPEPWYYDAANDRHWDPDHQHWHQGKPPQSGN